MAKSQTLQAMLEEQVEELPRLLAARLIRSKLEPFGCAGDDALVHRLVDHVLEGGGDGEVKFGAALDGVLPDDAVISFDDADIADLEGVIAEFRAGLPELMADTAKAASLGMLKRYKRRWSEWRPHAQAEMDRFKANLEGRWGRAFDLLRMLIELSRDQGVAFNRRASRRRSTRRASLDAALSHLHARAIQISSEAMTLMEAGFADGAMARWRTLHEVTCVAIVIEEGGDPLAQRYLAHEIVEARKGLRQFGECHEALGYAPFPRREAERIERSYEGVISQYGREFGGDYGWAAAHLGVARPTFAQIEGAAGRAMLRSHYKMASHNVHAGAKGIAHRLGAFQERHAALAGATNIGFVEPGQNVALSLLHLTALLLPRRWTLDKLALLSALADLQREIGPALARAERAITRDERRIRKEASERSARRTGAR